MQHMLHGIINEHGNCLDVRDVFQKKNTIFHMFSCKFLASGALILVIADIKPMDVYRCYK